jgi:hypothetical protein
MSPRGGIAAPVRPNKLLAGGVVNLFESQVFAFCSVGPAQKFNSVFGTLTGPCIKVGGTPRHPIVRSGHKQT